MIGFFSTGDTKAERNWKSQSCAKIWYDKFKPQIVVFLMCKLQIHVGKNQKTLVFPAAAEKQKAFSSYRNSLWIMAWSYLAIIFFNMWNLILDNYINYSILETPQNYFGPDFIPRWERSQSYLLISHILIIISFIHLPNYNMDNDDNTP